MKRSILEPVVHDSFRQQVLQPLRQWHSLVHAHIVISISRDQAANGTWQESLKQGLAAAYNATSTSLLIAEDSVARITTTRCPMSRGGNGKPKPMGRGQGLLLQWVGFSTCFDAVESTERNLGRSYDWIYRMRSDLSLHSRVPHIQALSASFVYVPAAGMTSTPSYRCMNDHFFVCPRALCRPYFRLLELWSSRYCMPTQRDAAYPKSWDLAATRHAEKTTTTLLPHGQPSETFELPYEPPHRLDAQWYFFARYSPGVICLAPQQVAECCGLIRLLPLSFIYSIVRCPLPTSCQSTGPRSASASDIFSLYSSALRRADPTMDATKLKERLHRMFPDKF